MLVNEIMDYLHTTRSASSWDIANAIYNNCMNFPHKSNGAKIANITKACSKSNEIDCYWANGTERKYFILKRYRISDKLRVKHGKY